jgi:hypothetical protein
LRRRRAEAEALAAERDQVLGELAELRRLEGERTGLLTEIEAALAERDAERQSAARELAEARDLADLHAAEVADLETRLQEEATSRARAEKAAGAGTRGGRNRAHVRGPGSA